MTSIAEVTTKSIQNVKDFITEPVLFKPWVDKKQLSFLVLIEWHIQNNKVNTDFTINNQPETNINEIWRIMRKLIWRQISQIYTYFISVLIWALENPKINSQQLIMWKIFQQFLSTRKIIIFTVEWQPTVELTRQLACMKHQEVGVFAFQYDCGKETDRWDSL